MKYIWYSPQKSKYPLYIPCCCSVLLFSSSLFILCCCSVILFSPSIYILCCCSVLLFSSSLFILCCCSVILFSPSIYILCCCSVLLFSPFLYIPCCCYGLLLSSSLFMPPKELWEAYSNCTVRLSVRQSVRQSVNLSVRPSRFRVRSISPIFFEIGIPNLVCGYILGWRSVAYHFRVTVALTLTSDLVFIIIVSGAYLLYYLR